MRTTINETVGRRGDAYSADDLEQVVENARKILADASAFLELRIEQLSDMPYEADDTEAYKAFEKQLNEVRNTWRTVLETQTKMGLSFTGGPPMDLEAAREEILGRLARLAP